MPKSNSLKLFAVLLLILTVFTACTSKKDLAKLPKTASNVILESFVPEDAWFTYSYFPTSETQKLFIEDHSRTIFQGREMALAEIALQSFLRNPLKSEVELLVTKGAPMIYSMNGDAATLETTFQATIVVDDAQSLQKMLETSVESQEILFTKTETGFAFEQFDPHFYGKFDGKFLHISNNALAFPLAENLDSESSPRQKSILASKRFKNALKKLSAERVGYFFIQQNIDAGIMSITNILAEQDGVRLHAFSEIPKQSNSLISDLFSSTKTYLDAKIPAKNIIVYVESHNLGDIVRLQLDAIKQNPSLNDALGDDFQKVFEEKIGLSLEKDIYPVLKKNFSIMIEDQNKIFPAVSAWADVSSNKDGAQKLLKQLDTALSSFVTLANVGSGQELMKRAKISWNGAEIMKITFYPNLYPQDKFPIPLFANLSEEWNLMYGISNDNMLFLTTRSEMPNPTIAQDSLYSELKTKIPGFDNTERTFVASEPIRNYLTRLVELGKKTGKISEQEITGIDVFWRLISPVRGLISGTRQNGKFQESQTFVRIGL